MARAAGQTVMSRLDELARFSSDRGALTRLYLSTEHKSAALQTQIWMQEAGMQAQIDPVANVVGRYEGREPGLPALLLGSHIDTVRNAGKYGGCLGVVAAIEAVAALHAAGERLPFAIEVIAFGDEEGVRFPVTLTGSRTVAGTLDPGALDAEDSDRVSVREALQLFGCNPLHIYQVARSKNQALAYCELHIEQGPVLEAEKLPVGIVTAINGASRYRVQIDGIAGHAGTVPMRLRQDALAAAAECVLAIEKRCTSEPDLVGTVGKLATHPGATNVIPGKVVFTIDVRSPRDDHRHAAAADIRRMMEEICARRGVALTIDPTHEGHTATCAPWLREQIGRAIAAEGLPVRELPSGAGHDGMALVDLTDIGMLFVRCKAGISHNPAEAVTLDDVAIGARVFLRFIEDFRPRQ